MPIFWYSWYEYHLILNFFMNTYPYSTLEPIVVKNGFLRAYNGYIVSNCIELHVVGGLPFITITDYSTNTKINNLTNLAIQVCLSHETLYI